MNQRIEHPWWVCLLMLAFIIFGLPLLYMVPAGVICLYFWAAAVGNWCLFLAAVVLLGAVFAIPGIDW